MMERGFELTPTAGPWIAAMVGFRHLWIARDTLPPLEMSKQSAALHFISTTCENHSSSQIENEENLPIPMFLAPNPFRPLKSNFQISTSTKILPFPRDNNNFYSVILIQHIECPDEIVFHYWSEHVVFFDAGDGDKYYGCYGGRCWGVVGERYLGESQGGRGGVGGWWGEGGHFEGMAVFGKVDNWDLVKMGMGELNMKYKCEDICLHAASLTRSQI